MSDAIDITVLFDDGGGGRLGALVDNNDPTNRIRVHYRGCRDDSSMPVDCEQTGGTALWHEAVFDHWSICHQGGWAWATAIVWSGELGDEFRSIQWRILTRGFPADYCEQGVPDFINTNDDGVDELWEPNSCRCWDPSPEQFPRYGCVFYHGQRLGISRSTTRSLNWATNQCSPPTDTPSPPPSESPEATLSPAATTGRPSPTSTVTSTPGPPEQVEWWIYLPALDTDAERH